MGVRDFISIVRELSFDDIRAEAEIAPRLLVIANDRVAAQQLARRLFGPEGDGYVDTRTFDEINVDPLRYDAIVTLGPLHGTSTKSWGQLFRRAGEPMRLVRIDLSDVDDPQSFDKTRQKIASLDDERVLAIGRYIPRMRAAAAERVVSETAMVNGQFALVSNIPAVIPILGNIVAVGADFLVLTKNQLMMIFKLAAIYGRDLSNRWRIYSEMLPVVGAGLVWRTVAREVAALLPLAVGTVPKVAIAYAGTWAAGRAADIYYAQGERVSREKMRSLYSDALGRLKQNPISAVRGRDEKRALEAPASESSERPAS